MKQDERYPVRIITDKEAEYITRVEELGYELRVQEVMTVNVKSLTPDTSMSDALEIFRAARISGAPVVGPTGLVGVISLEDLIRWLTSGSTESTVDEYMSTTVTTVRKTDPVMEALRLFVDTRHGRLVVGRVHFRLPVPTSPHRPAG